MPPPAVLLLDLQRDFLGGTGARLPVELTGATAVLRTANAILTRRVLPAALPVLVVTEFPAAARVANFFRRGAAIAGTPGAEIDPRVGPTNRVPVIPKARSSAFTNPELQRYLHVHGVTELYVLGVFAEGCVRATVRDARRLGSPATVIVDAIATNARWQRPPPPLRAPSHPERHRFDTEKKKGLRPLRLNPIFSWLRGPDIFKQYTSNQLKSLFNSLIHREVL